MCENSLSISGDCLIGSSRRFALAAAKHLGVGIGINGCVQLREPEHPNLAEFAGPVRKPRRCLCA
jgi:hypothetical protein